MRWGSVVLLKILILLHSMIIYCTHIEVVKKNEIDYLTSTCPKKTLNISWTYTYYYLETKEDT